MCCLRWNSSAGFSDQLLGMLLATPVQRAALEIMRATSIQPLERQAALQAGSGHGDELPNGR